MLTIAFIVILTALLYSRFERATRDAWSFKRNGAIRFVKVGRFSGSYCVRKG